MYAGQGAVQSFILLIAFVCVPWLLCVKPFLLWKQHRDHRNGGVYQPVGNGSAHDSSPYGSRDSNDDHSSLLKGSGGDDGHSSSHGGGHGGGHGHGGDFDFGEVIIHQAIETIEFVLGMVSNTASYLRLWALSLAHTELASVFWEKAMLTAIETNNPVLVFMGYAVFAATTFGVLLAMDVLECFLHALRLHWVEFQNKFFKADGYLFVPFSFARLLEQAILD
jgi:V-type H+-transporting ATPase subunit a